MASLFNTLPQDTYSSLIKFIDNTGSAGPIKQLTDGAGTSFPLYLNSTTLSGSISASYATTSSYSLTASYALNGGGSTVSTASLLITASSNLNVLTFTKGDGSTFNVTVNTGSATTVSTASLLTTASVNLNTITFTKGDASTFNITVNTGSATTVSTASLLITASISTNVLTFTKGNGNTFPITIASSSYSVTSSYSLTSLSASNALQCSYAEQAIYATSAGQAATASNANGIYNAVTNNTNDYVLTATGGTTINGEKQLRFNTTDGLIVSGSGTVVTAQVAGTTNGGVYIGSNGSNESGLYDLAGDTPMAIFWDNGGTQYVQYNTIYSNVNGKNGVNTASPSYALDINASGNTGARVYSGSLAVGNITPSATVGRIDASNDVVAFSTSDIRLKTNIEPILNPITKIEAIGGYTFDWKPEHKDLHGFEGHDVGVIAQEIEVIMPEVVTTRDSGYKAVKYEKLVPLLIEAIKDLQKQIDELKNK